MLLLLAVCWYYQPSLLPILVYLFFEFIVKLIAIYCQQLTILDADNIPKELQGKFDEAKFHKARCHSMAKNKLQCLNVVVEQIWKGVQIVLGNLLFGFAIAGLAVELELSRKVLKLHFPTLELISITLAFTLIKLLIFVYEPALRFFCIDNAAELNKLSGDAFFYGYFNNMIVSMLKNTLMISTFCEISSIAYDVIGYSWPSMYIASWVVYVAINCLLEYTMGGTMVLPNEKLTPISEFGGFLPKFIQMAAKKMEFPENRIFVSDASTRTAKQNICLRGLGFQKLVIDDHLLIKYEKVFNPPVVEFDDQEGVDEKMNDEIEEINNGSEILALVTVQLARWKFNNAWTVETFNKLYALLTFGVISFLIVENETLMLAKFFGLEQPTVVAFFVIIYLILEWGRQHLKYNIKRAQELSADSYAVKAGYSEDLKKALIDMSMNNLEFPAMAKMYQSTFGSNSLLTRLKEIDKEASTCSNEEASKLFIHSVKSEKLISYIRK